MQPTPGKLKRNYDPLAEARRLQELAAPESSLREQGFHWVAGVDEAGRGPLAGPVLAAAVILPSCWELPGLNDSKQVSPAERERLARGIKEQAVTWALGLASPAYIDTHNILQATMAAMRVAVQALAVIPDLVLVDGMAIRDLELLQNPMVQGDCRSATIAAASILAKTERDRLMRHWDEIYPEYGFARHKGYGTPQHLQVLQQQGACRLHRQSFAPVRCQQVKKVGSPAENNWGIPW